MAPSTSTSPSTTPKRTRSSASSGVGASLKQGKLAFSSLKRSESTPSISSGKAKGKKNVAHQPQLALTAQPNTETADSSSDSSDDEVEERVVIRRRSLRVPAATLMKDAKPEGEAVPRKTLNVNDRRWNAIYGQAKKKMGNVAAVHAKVNEITKIDDILRVFDMSYEYGPCVGVTRLERWSAPRRWDSTHHLRYVKFSSRRKGFRTTESPNVPLMAKCSLSTYHVPSTMFCRFRPAVYLFSILSFRTSAMRHSSLQTDTCATLRDPS